jgi:flagella basal body P-ring formation protein FlgA
MSSAKENRRPEARLRPLTAALVLAILGLLLPTATRGQDVRLTLEFKPEASVRGDRVLLKDLVDIRGEDGALRRDLAEVYVTQAPRPGQTLKIRGDYLTYRVRNAGLPLDLLPWNPPSLILVTRQAQEIGADAVQKIVIDYLKNQDPYRTGDWELAGLRVSRLPQFPRGTLTHKVQAGSISNPAHLRLTVTFYVNKEEAAQVQAAALIRIFQPVVVAARQIEPDQVIQEEDLRVERVSMDRFRAAALSEPGQAKGLVSRRRLSVGRPILAQDLRPQVVVHRGDRVAILAENDVLAVSAPGHAQKDGARGETIPVLNLDSKKVVLGTVAGPDAVRVTF